MTRAQLESLRAANALPHTLRYDQLAPYHVPFDELCGGSAVEGELAHWLAHRGRVALIGPSGSGKSSALAWVLAHRRPENLAVLRIPIALADDDTVKTTAGFARHLIRRVIAAARFGDGETGDLRNRAADTLRRGGGARQRSHSLGLNVWVLKGELARELTRSGEEFEEQIGAGEVVEGLQRLVELFRARDTDPVLVLDDTDTWITRPHDRQPAQLADAFFARNVRMLASEIDCGFILAVHTSYLDLPAYREIAPRLERIRVPSSVGPRPTLRASSPTDLGSPASRSRSIRFSSQPRSGFSPTPTKTCPTSGARSRLPQARSGSPSRTTTWTASRPQQCGLPQQKAQRTGQNRDPTCRSPSSSIQVAGERTTVVSTSGITPHTRKRLWGAFGQSLCFPRM